MCPRPAPVVHRGPRRPSQHDELCDLGLPLLLRFLSARGRMEVDVTAMHGYGLRATIEPLGDDGEGSASDAAGGR